MYYTTVTKTAKVEDLQFKTATDNSLTLTWSSVKNATGYVIYKLDSETGTYKSVAKTTDASFKDTDVSVYKTYKYKLKAYRTYNKTNYYSSSTGEVLGYTAPNKVSKLVSTSTNAKKIKLSWKKGKATGYKVYRYNSQGKYELIKTITSSDTTYYMDTVASGTKYKYLVKAYRKVNGKTLCSGSTKITSIGKSTAKVKASSLNVRSSASTSAKVKVKIPKNTKLTIIGSANTNWYKITVKKGKKIYTGYVLQKYVKV
jgi:fibronectin type 3 domain-containing protein